MKLIIKFKQLKGLATDLEATNKQLQTEIDTREDLI